MGDSGPRTAIVTLSHGARSRGTAYGHSTPPGHPCHAHPPASSLGRLAPRGSPGSTVCPPQGWCSSKQWTCDRCLEAENGPKSDDVYRMYDGAYQHRRSSSCFSKVQVNTSTVTSKGTSIEPSTCGTWQGTFSSERPRTTVKITPQVKTVPSPPKPVHLIPVPHLHSRAGSGHGFCQFGFGASTRAASTATKKVDGHNGRRGPGQKMASKCTCGWSGQAPPPPLLDGLGKLIGRAVRVDILVAAPLVPDREDDAALERRLAGLLEPRVPAMNWTHQFGLQAPISIN